MNSPLTSVRYRSLRGAALALIALTSSGALRGVPMEDLKRLSLEELMEVEVTSVSRRSERLVDTAAAIEVLSGDRIQRSGAWTLPDALRLATGVQVSQLSGREWAISARGFASSASEKMEVTQDGRTLYSPLFSGVTWDIQSVLMEDLDRIEVIRGPGAAMWGSNAVNGVLSIVTKSAADTQGSYVNFLAGSHERHAAVRYGGAAAGGFFRVYVQAFETDGLELADGSEAADSRELAKVGARGDYTVGDAGRLTLHGEYYRGEIGQIGLARSTVSGGHARARFERPWPTFGGALRAQALVEFTERDIPVAYAERRRTFDTFVETDVDGERYSATVGTRLRISGDDFDRRATLYFDPLERRVTFWTLYAQGRVELPDERWSLLVGAALEHNSFSDWEFQPLARLLFKWGPNSLLWAGAAHAVRSPSRIDVDVVVPAAGGATLLAGNPNSDAETLDAFEAGWRWNNREVVAVAVNAFINRYERLRTFEPATFPIILRNDNLAEGEARGLEASVTWQPHEALRLIAGARWLDKTVTLMPQSQSTIPLSYQGNDARRLFTAQLSWDVRVDLLADVVVRHVSALPQPAVPAYTEADARIAWRHSSGLEFAATGRNLLHRRHREHAGTTQEFVPRSLYLSVTWRH